jgi:hypothetical protein
MGRPRRKDTASTTIVTFRLTAHEKKLLDRIAERRDSSLSDVLRALIKREAAALGLGDAASEP